MKRFFVLALFMCAVPIFAYKGNSLSVGIGAGSQYSGLGIAVENRFDWGGAIGAGVGDVSGIFTFELLGKYFPFPKTAFNPYLSVQYGMTNVVKITSDNYYMQTVETKLFNGTQVGIGFIWGEQHCFNLGFHYVASNEYDPSQYTSADPTSNFRLSLGYQYNF